MTYSIHLIDEKGQGSYLSVKDRTAWKTKRAATRHLQDVLTLITKGKFPAVTADLEDEHGALIATPPPRTLTLKAGPGCTPIHLADALIYIGADAIEAGEKRGDIETRGPWNIISSYKALATTATWKDKPGGPYVDEYTLHGVRTLSGAKESGYNLEGTVSIEGQKRSAFTSSIMFEIIETGKLVDVAVIHARSQEATGIKHIDTATIEHLRTLDAVTLRNTWYEMYYHPSRFATGPGSKKYVRSLANFASNLSTYLQNPDCAMYKDIAERIAQEAAGMIATQGGRQ